MPERIYKLQPNRTLALRGFDSLGAGTALHSATSSSFKVSGVFRDAADFAVLVLHDADNFYEHPRIKHLPDFDFSGLTLQFDAAYTGLMPLDSPKFPTIDWPFLDVIRTDGTTARIRLFDYATQVGGTYLPATASFTVVDGGLKQFDRLTLWYLNFAYDYVVPQVEGSLVFTASGVAGTQHWIDVAGVRYQVSELTAESNTALTARLAAAASASPRVSVAQVAPGNQIDFRNISGDGQAYVVAGSSGGSFTLNGVSAAFVAQTLAAQISGANYSSVAVPISATASGTTIQISARPGIDGNFVRMYAVSKNSRLTTSASTAVFSGGSSSATWRVTLDFSARGVPSIRQMWLTFAPPLAYGAAIGPTEFEAVFTNWNLTGLESRRALQVAGPGSVRVEESDPWCTYTGAWAQEEGFYSGGFARRASVVGDTVTVFYSCASVHDLYIGTSLYGDRGVAGVRLDGDAETDLNCALTTTQAVVTRRRVRTAVPAGQHTVVIRLKSAGFFYFDFLEAAIPGDVPDAMPSQTAVSPALDYSTDHTYKLSPARIHWALERLGFNGPMNEYIGVFWWNQRVRTGAVIPSATVTFSGSFVSGDAIFVSIGSQTFGKSVFPDETLATFAQHFAFAINAASVGVFAQASGAVLTLTTRSPEAAYSFTLTASVTRFGGSTGTATVSGSLSGGVVGQWAIDTAATPVLNRGARAWHADMFAECAARSREITVAASMELVNPPANFAARFPQGEPVVTAIAFGSLSSTHCAFSSPVLDYHKRLYLELAGMMSAASLTPVLQMGEFVWWFFTNWSLANPTGGMGFYDAETASAAQTALGRPLYRFLTPADSPAVNGGADALFLRNRLRSYTASIVTHVRTTYPSAKFEVLFPYDVNHPVPAGVNQLGGALNRYVNLPVEWESSATAGFDRLKIEALDFGAWSRDLTLAESAIDFGLNLNWPKSAMRYLVPIFRAASAWRKEFLIAQTKGYPVLNLWAWDQMCLLAHDPTQPENHGRASSD